MADDTTPADDAAEESDETVDAPEESEQGDGDAGDAADAPAAEPTPAPEPTVVDEGPADWPADKEQYGYIWGTGRRKSSVARVRLRRGSGQFFVNDRPFNQYFTSEREQGLATAALRSTKRLEHYDVFVRAGGGGTTGQAGAVLLGVARALKIAEPRLEPVLRENDYLSRDSRQKERKKYGQRGARRGFQFSKR